ncbi:glycosyltransferase family 4 protein [Actinomycetospora lemnae]|uniref:Glycosyltransferase family 4 protein n=1 Tax=Actinomycetospora lemnae TaxID=3019891 RepID=A0ABT5SWE5_9PSEU|nr:glycosyltransferase family 4 protein [Actinomycetospora sp. DW7H6]MDD7966785.1 glycosyltransferase family 4 protein [Actinomycetospora sp. DW7H6]
MRILTHSAWLEPVGGVEVCTLQDSLGLRTRGHALDVVYGVDGPFREQYEQADVGLFGPAPFHFDPRRAPGHLRSFLPAVRWARARRPDVVWLNRTEHLVWGQTVSRLTGAPLVCHLHVLPAYRRMRLFGHGVAHFAAVSEFVRGSYLERGVPPERVSVLPNAVRRSDYPVGGRTERAVARHRLGLPQDAPIVLCYGQMTPEKGVATLVRAWSAVRARRPDAVLVLVDALAANGQRPSDGLLRGLDPRAYRLFGASGDVVPFLHAADLVAFPTLLPETFGRVVIETMSSGRPVVASRVGAVPEILGAEMEHLLVEPDAPDELARRLESLLDWRVTEPDLGGRCSAWVDQCFAFDAHLDGLEDIFARHARGRAVSAPTRAARRLRR